MEQYTTVDDYLAAMPAETRAKLERLRRTVRQEAPDAVEKISYGIPTFVLHGNLVHYAGYENHIGFYPGSEAIRHFADRLEGFETGKSTVRFPLDRPLPLELVRDIVRFRVRATS
jgi:uncharacterized protein YdhG (YjbR/CyaY superfamily)